MILTHSLRLADRDMFMRFRGGGVGHLYMRQIEPWLDATGWGASWPMLRDRDPCPDQDSPQQESSGAEMDEEDENIGDSNSEKDEEMSDVEDEIEEDPERLEDSDEESDEDEEDGEDGEITRVPSDGESDNGEEGNHL
jgi:hypothetical protein